MGVQTVTVAQMRGVDRIMVDELHIGLLQMMEYAGRCLAAHTRDWLGGVLSGRHVMVLAGSGGNAGGGLVAARRLTIWGAGAAVPLGQPWDKDRGVPAHQLESTLTLALPKTGLARLAAREWVGDLYLAGISVPAQVDRRLGLETGPIFATSDIVAAPVGV